MKVKKSREYAQDDGSKVSYTFDRADGKIIGITKNGESLNPNTNEFKNFSQSDDALAAYNVAKYGNAKKSYTKNQPETKTSDELNSYHNQQNKKETNEDKDISTTSPSESSLAAATNYGIGNPFTGYNNAKRGRKVYAEVFAYPLDIDPLQDHLKIKKYKYQRTSVQAGRPNRVNTVKGEEIKNKRGRITGYKDDTQSNVAGDSVLGMEQLGTVILPMPKVVDTNGAEWGESKINILGLAAMGAGKKLGQIGISDEEQERLKQLNKQFKNKPGKGKTSDFKDVLGAIGGATFTQAASTALGQQISTNEFLARASGRVLNPNAELLFQGPVLRDFNFDFLMIARSREEGDEIRRIIRWFKTGMAPRFNDATFLETPDVFSLEYKRGQGPTDILDTVNRFNPGGLALRTIAVDYAPNGYWSAYQDSQPVAIRMSLNFAELRPIFASDQEMTPASSVGY